MIVFTSIFIGVGLFLLIKEIMKRFRCTVLTDGVVIDYFYKEEWDRDGHSVTRYPIYEYYDSHGNRYEQKSHIGGTITPRLGKHVVIGYNQFNPSDYYVKGDGSIFFSIIFIGIGLFVQLVANG